MILTMATDGALALTVEVDAPVERELVDDEQRSYTSYPYP